MRRMIAKIKNVRCDEIAFYPQNMHLDGAEESLFLEMLDRHGNNEPLSKILNSRSFWNHEFFVNAQVLDPRPETELMIEMILSRFDAQSCLNFLDVGTGSGCILLSLLHEYKNSHGVGVDISLDAIEVAKRNQKILGIQNADFLATDWSNFYAEEKFDVVVGNPPYVKTGDIPKLDENVRNYDPLLALDGGADGLAAYASIAACVKRWLAPSGLIFLEIGYDQAKSVPKILQSNGLEVVEIKKDLSGIDRIITAALLLT
jgi:release factor glutamine methyltransferase